MAERFQLYVQEGPEPGRVIDLNRDEMRLGRSPLLDIVLDDPEVSRQQTIFTRTEAGFIVQDSGSTNGTFVDGRRLGGEPVLLKPGTTIRIGSSVVLLFQVAPDETVSPLDAILDESRARMAELDVPAEEEEFDFGAEALTLPDTPDEPEVPPMAVETAAPPVAAERAPARRNPPPTRPAPPPEPAPVYHDVPAEEGDGRNRRMLIWVAVGVVLLGVCCCILISVLLFLSAEGTVDVPSLTAPLVEVGAGRW